MRQSLPVPRGTKIYLLLNCGVNAVEALCIRVVLAETNGTFTAGKR